MEIILCLFCEICPSPSVKKTKKNTFWKGNLFRKRYDSFLDLQKILRNFRICDQITEEEAGGVCFLHGGEQKSTQNLAQKPEINRCDIDKPSKWEESIKTDLKGTGREDVGWNRIRHRIGKLAGCCEHGNEHWVSIKCGKLTD